MTNNSIVNSFVPLKNVSYEKYIQRVVLSEKKGREKRRYCSRYGTYHHRRGQARAVQLQNDSRSSLMEYRNRTHDGAEYCRTGSEQDARRDPGKNQQPLPGHHGSGRLRYGGKGEERSFGSGIPPRNADESLRPVQQRFRQDGQGWDASQVHAAEIPDGVRPPEMFSRNEIPCERHRAERDRPRVHQRFRVVSPHGKPLHPQYGMGVSYAAAQDDNHRHRERVARARPVHQARDQHGGDGAVVSDERGVEDADGYALYETQARTRARPVRVLLLHGFVLL